MLLVLVHKTLTFMILIKKKIKEIRYNNLNIGQLDIAKQTKKQIQDYSKMYLEIQVKKDINLVNIGNHLY